MQIFKRFVFLLIAIFTVLAAESQEFTNSWIDFGQQYYRVGIPRTGIYRIYRNQLEEAGVPISNYKPQNIQLFQNGKLIACYIDGEAQGLCRYIEFFAEGNDGSFDVEMYDNPKNQTNPHYSLVTDEAAVFITFNSNFSNLRLSTLPANNTFGYDTVDYCLIDTVLQYTSTYLSGEENSLYTAGEGWFDATALTLGGKVTKTIPTPNVYVDTSLSATFKMALGTYSSSWHHLTVEFADFFADTIFAGIRTLKYSASIPTDKLSTRNSLIISCINDMQATTDYSRMSFAELVYPATFNFANRRQQIFELPPSNVDKCVVISGMDLSQGATLYDVTHNLRISLNIDGNAATAIVPAHTEASKMIIIDNLSFASASKISEAKLTNHAVSGNQTIIISHSSIMAAAKRYANYRNAYLVDIEEIYNQFGYGIIRHPLAIRKFIEYVTSEWTVKPENLFIIGKGLPVNTTRKSTSYDWSSLVPAMGNPPSDALLSAYIAGSGAAPSLATGRLAALTEADVDNYLDKVKAFEANQPAEWMKRVLHFCGGKTTPEQNIINSYMSDYESIITDTLFGGAVTTFYKLTSDPISTSKNDSVNALINNGVSLMTFFGHGSANSGFDQDIDSPSNFKNEGRYPLILSNSCHTGNIFAVSQNNVSERWVLIPKKGAIGLIAMVNQGVISYLNRFSSAFYNNIANKMYGEPIGKALQAALQSMSNSTARLNLCAIQQMTLHGDPCIVLNSPPKPDLQISVTDVAFSPKLLSTEVDSFTINITLRNIAKSITKPFTVSVERQLTNGNSIVIEKNIDKLDYKQTISFRFPIDPINGTGLNVFNVKLDTENTIDELSEDNNEVSVSVYVASNLLRAVSPYQYSLNASVPNEFVLSTSNVLAENQISVFQIDTTECFDSPILHTEQMEHCGGVVRWQPKTKLDTATTYFWRVGDGSTDSWSESSFIARNGLAGWEQSHFEQLDDNSFSQIVVDSANRTFEFASAYSTIRCHNVGSPNNDDAYMSIYYAIDGYGGASSCGVNSALLLVVIDSTTLVPWISERGQFGQYNYPKCSSNPTDQYFIFYMWTPSEGVSRLINMIENNVPNGNYFMIYSFISGKFQQWPDSAYKAFENWGAEKIRIIDNNVPYIFFSQKGHPDQAEEIVGETTTSAIDFTRTLRTTYTEGSITSTAIGPSSKWTSLEWQAKSEVSDNDYVNILGVEKDGATSMLISHADTSKVDLTAIDAEHYKYLKLQFVISDDSLRTPSQLKWWRVLYNSYTDLAVNPQRAWQFYADTLNEGEQGQAIVAFENIGSQKSDNLLIHYWLQTEQNQIINIGYHRLSALQMADYIIDTVNFSTVGLSGDVVFYAELNPCAEGETDYDQPELTHFNNFIIKQFHVLRDVRNPLLDVTIDGRHIQDGEIVSATPTITIRLTDENQHFALADTNLFSVYLTSLTTGIEEKIYINNVESIFETGTIEQNVAQLQLTLNLKDDTYQLRARAHDASGNESGIDDYIISFQVIAESTITDIYAFPNPFSSQMRFGFELTGSVLPDDIQIDIFTIDGKIVRSFNITDFSDLHIGQNLSACVWNGTNQHGALLPSGVYFYKAKATINGQTIKRRPSAAPALKNGVGRIVIMR